MPYQSVLILAIVAMAVVGHTEAAELRLGRIFGDHVVLQRDTPLPVWGWASPDQRVDVSFAGQTVRTTTLADGRWKVQLEPVAASMAGRELVVSAGEKDVTVRDVLVGDVWHASGQSNMAMTMQSVK